ncbi:MAG TPA: hypothetical protein ENN91_02790, partial [Firmicutes bacterium]|nr:hypothetical protein [Bacillota bacterium]
EYPGSDSSIPAIYLLEPEEKALTPAEAEALLTASRRWEQQLPSTPPGANPETAIMWESTSSAPRRESATIQFQPAETAPRLEGYIDNRTAVGPEEATAYPYYNVGFLNIHFPDGYMRGTAFLISPYVALTNGHNVYTRTLGGWFDSIDFIPSQYEEQWPGVIRPFFTRSPVNVETNDFYLSYEDAGDRENSVNYDYAALFFDRPFNGITTFMPFEFNSLPDKVTVIGYPGTVRGKNSTGMWRADGSLLTSDEYCLYYDAFTSPGNSGSPVVVFNRQAGSYRLAAIHTFALPDYFSGGLHFNEHNRRIIEQWLNWQPDTASDPAGTIDSLTLNKKALSLTIGDREALIATVKPEKNGNTELIWSSSNPAAVTVDANGLLRAVGPGEAWITVTTADRKLKAQCLVKISPTSATEDQPAGISGRGDIDGDGKIDVVDVTLIFQHSLNLIELEESRLKQADLNGDNLINVLDAAMLMRHVLGLNNAAD